MTTKTHFEKLFQPGQIGPMSLRNRLVMAPMLTRCATVDGYVTERLKSYYEERAKGGVGLIIVEATSIESTVGKRLWGLSVDDDRFIPGLRQLAQVIQRHGVKAALQIGYDSTVAAPALYRQAMAPTAMINRKGWLGSTEQPREISVAEIAEAVDCFTAAARRTKEAGFDGVEIHAAHAYLIASFLSSYFNRRTDAYGGSLKNRARFLLEIVGAVRKAVGRDYPLWCRINGEEYGTGGFTLEDAQEVARLLQEAGVDGISVSSTAWFHDSPFPFTLPSGRQWTYPRGWQVYLAAGIKEVVSVPVMACGRLSPQVGERVLQEEKADLILMGRALLADPELPNKAALGRSGDIVPCLACNECYVLEMPVHCTINAALGKEREYSIKPAERLKKVLVAGGGPAGMEAARVASLRGHEVTLYEKDHELGGQLLVAAVPPSRRGIQTLTGYLKSQVKKLGVKVELGKEVTPQLVDELKPDTVILATGVTPFIPELPGVGKKHVVKAVDVLAGRAEIGERVVVIGGELVGCNVAEFLAEKGKKVAITRRGPALLLRAGPNWRGLTLNHLLELGISMVTGVRYEEITDAGLVITTQEGERKTIEADTVVLAAGARPDRNLFKELEGKVPEIYLVGDCVAPRRALYAVADGSRIARQI